MSLSEKRGSRFTHYREQIIEMIRKDGEVRVSKVEEQTGAARSTAHRWLVRARRELEQVRVSEEGEQGQADVSPGSEEVR